MASLVPPLTARGLWTLAEPFQAQPDIEYWVGAIRSFKELKSRQIDITNLVYTPAGLTDEERQEDELNNAQIVTLLSHTRSPILVPSTYIQSYPNAELIPYSRLVLSASIGPLPDSLDASLIVQSIKDLLSAVVGVEPDVRLGKLPHTGAVTPEEHEQYEQARAAQIDHAETTYAKMLRLEEENRELQDRLELYEQWMIDSGVLEEQGP